MDSESDNFLKALQKRQRNLAKKLDRIHKKQAEVKTTGKDMKEEERKMIESEPQIQELLTETEKLIQQYQKHLESSQKEQKKPQPKPEDNKSKEVVSLWVLGEFLSNPQVKEKFLKENPGEQDLEAFLSFHSQAKGHTGNTLSEISSSMEKSVELYLAKSDKIAQGTMRTFKKLSEFTVKGLSWALNQARPLTPVKNELSVQTVPVYSTQVVQVVEKKPEPEEIKIEPKPEPKVEAKVEPKHDVPVSSWAEEAEEDEEWGEKTEAKAQEPAKTVNEDDGFTEVKSRRDKKGEIKPREEEFERRGRGRGRGRRGDRGDRGERGERRGRGGRGRGQWQKDDQAKDN